MKIQSKLKINKESAKLWKDDYASNIKRLKDKNFNLTVVRNGKISKEKCVPCLNCLGHFNPKTLKKKTPNIVLERVTNQKKNHYL